MKLGAFLLLSLALHATALTYPVFFLGSKGEALLPVVVLGSGEGNGGGSMGNGGGGKGEQPAARKNRAAVEATEQRSGGNVNGAGTRDQNPIPISAVEVTEGIAVAGLNYDPAGAEGPAAGQVAAGDGGSALGGGGKGNSGFGTGTGNGIGGGGVRFTQVGYAYNPRPEYPAKARKEGREGTVVLRVLVDEEGKSKSLEVNRSSGSALLDDAAVETVKRWRFSPARYGERRVESWVRIPIVFRLADVKD